MTGAIPVSKIAMILNSTESESFNSIKTLTQRHKISVATTQKNTGIVLSPDSENLAMMPPA